MKKKRLLLFTFVLAFSSVAKAQKTDSAALPVKSGNEWQMPKDVLARSRAFADRCQQLLALDNPTTERLFKLYLGNTKSVDEIRIGKGSEKEKKDALAANQQQFDLQVKPLVTPAQFDSYMRARKAGKL